jgi:hypothetical protein
MPSGSTGTVTVRVSDGCSVSGVVNAPAFTVTTFA